VSSDGDGRTNVNFKQTGVALTTIVRSECCGSRVEKLGLTAVTAAPIDSVDVHVGCLYRYSEPM
jgi:hypothetical protein